MRKLIVDCESLIYRACVATQELAEISEGIYSQVYNVSKGLDYLKNQLDEMYRATNAEDYIFVIGSSENYRKIINPKYKSNRKQQPHPMLKKMIEVVCENFNTTYIPFLEADDTCRIIYEEDKFNNIIVSIDKDLRTFFCRLYNPDQPSKGIQNISVATAQYNFFKQLIMGDSCDGYGGIKGYGDKSAEKWLLQQDRTLDDIIDLYVENGYSIKDFNTVYNMARIISSSEFKDGIIQLKGSKFNTETGKEF